MERIVSSQRGKYSPEFKDAAVREVIDNSLFAASVPGAGHAADDDRDFRDRSAGHATGSRPAPPAGLSRWFAAASTASRPATSLIGMGEKLSATVGLDHPIEVIRRRAVGRLARREPGIDLRVVMVISPFVRSIRAYGPFEPPRACWPRPAWSPRRTDSCGPCRVRAPRDTGVVAAPASAGSRASTVNPPPASSITESWPPTLVRRSRNPVSPVPPPERHVPSRAPSLRTRSSAVHVGVRPRPSPATG